MHYGIPPVVPTSSIGPVTLLCGHGLPLVWFLEAKRQAEFHTWVDIM